MGKHMSINKKYVNCEPQQEMSPALATKQPEPITSISIGARPYTIFIHGEIQEDDGIFFEEAVNSFILDEEGEEQDLERLYIDIDTVGGSRRASLSIAAQIEELKAKGTTVYCVVKGDALSGGCIVLLHGSVRYARKYSQIMFHIPFFVLPESEILNKERLKLFIEELDADAEILRKMLEERTNLSAKKIDKIIKNGEDYTMNVEEALRDGFIDEVL